MTRHVEYMVEFRPAPPLPDGIWFGTSDLGLLRVTIQANEAAPRPAAFRVWRRRFWLFWFLIAVSPPREGRGEDVRGEEPTEAGLASV